MTLGFIGTGALTSAIVTGLKSFGDDATPVLVSPRNEEIAAALAARFPDVRVAADNQAVLDGCETVMLGVRPQIAHEVLSQLQFRRHHNVVSLIATLSLDEIAGLVAPAAHTTKALPMPMIALRQAATIVLPSDQRTSAFFAKLGKVIEIDDAREFDALSVVTATYATYFKTLDTMHGWLKRQGVPEAKGRDYIVSIYKALSNAPDTMPDADFTRLSADYATRGGINEHVLRDMTNHGVFETFAATLESVHKRIAGS